MSFPQSGLYVGKVRHARSRPHAHQLEYNVFSLFLDLDEVAALTKRLRLLTKNRFGLFSIRNEDFGNGSNQPLKQQVAGLLADDGAGFAIGKVYLLAYPRMLGYVFNPLTVYYVYDTAGRLATLIYEVTNTFRERLQYVLPVQTSAGADAAAEISQACDKALYVSPFTSSQGHYRFRINAPAERLALAIAFADQDGPMLNASFTGRWQPLNDASLFRLAHRIPLLSLKVTTGIHYEAAKLWLKGNPIFRHHPAPRYRSIRPPDELD